MYSRVLNVAIKDVDQAFWMSYLDDILTFSEPLAYFGHITQVVLAHAAAGIKINLCKTKLFQSKVEYLGHRISKEGVHTRVCTEDQGWPKPKTGQEVSTFLRFAGYYLRLIQQYSAFTNMLNRIKNAEKFTWNEEIERDFKELKRAFIQGGIETFPNFETGNPFILTMDWSKENIVRVLSQVQDGQEQYLSCWGRKCNKYEKNYQATRESC